MLIDMAIIFENSDIAVDHVVVGPLDNNVFTIFCAQSGEAILIDAADENEMLEDICKQMNVRKVITTHGHFDHIGAVAHLRNVGIDVGVHLDDAQMLPSYDFILNDEDIIEVGKLRLKLMHTPGHTPGSICIKIEGTPFLFSGDTLFPGGPGNTQLPGGDFLTIMKSIESRLMTLDFETLVLPGHGNSTTIGNEKDSIDAWSRRGW
ncbi:MAG: MBL fold metallo-hydrolase [Acidimicrobiia bacterium]|nr:MBL fold metallo-hydrolase [Acidimicrobiia bacterium]